MGFSFKKLKNESPSRNPASPNRSGEKAPNLTEKSADASSNINTLPGSKSTIVLSCKGPPEKIDGHLGMTARTKQNQCAIATAGIIEEISEIGFSDNKRFLFGNSYGVCCGHNDFFFFGQTKSP